jgi:hypothetical protein
METRTKPYGKYEIVPTVEQVMALVEFYEKTAKRDGTVSITQKDMMEQRAITQHIRSASYLNGIITYLANEGFIKKLYHGGKGRSATLDVSVLLDSWDKVKTRDVIGYAHPEDAAKATKKVDPANVEVSIIRNEEPVVVETPEVEIPAVQPVSTTPKNSEVLAQLNSAMQDMIGYLQAMPAEMSGHLRAISNQLELTDENALQNLQDEISEWQNKYGNLQVRLENETGRFQAEKKDLENEVQRLKSELEEASSKQNYNTHHIYRQRNSILDEVDRMLTVPSWTLRQNGANFRKTIESKLDEIMKEIGVEETTN